MRLPNDNKGLIEMIEAFIRGLILMILVLIAILITTAIAKADGSRQFLDDYVQQMAPCQPDSRPYYLEKVYPKGIIDYPENHYKHKFVTVPTPSFLEYLLFIPLLLIGAGLVIYAYGEMYKKAKYEISKYWVKRRCYK